MEAKEQLRERVRQVDTLTLSATPIPRTLNMALSGVRDMSGIEQPPQDRQPVQTYVLEHDWGVGQQRGVVYLARGAARGADKFRELLLRCAALDAV